MRGRTSVSTVLSPMVCMASISSLTRMVPIWAVKAEPERPATMMAVISPPISRSTPTPRRLMVKTSAPKRLSWSAP